MGEPAASPPSGDAGWTLGRGGASGEADPLLDCLGWLTRHHGRPLSADALAAGLPLEDGRLDPDSFIRAAGRAGLGARLVRRPLARIPAVVLPAVLLLTGRRAAILAAIDEGGADIRLPETGFAGERVPLDRLAGMYAGHALFARPEPRSSGQDEERPRPRSWFWGTLARLWPAYAEVVLAAGLINLLGLAAPLFIMNVYDRVLPNQAIPTLWVLASGVAIAFLFDFVLRTLRGVLIDTAGRRADVLLAARIFEQVMNLRVAARPASTGAFASQLREFEQVRDFFTSATLASATDLLFIGLTIFIVWVIAGPLALVPAIAVLATLAAGLVLQVPLRRAARAAQAESAEKHAILVEAVGALDTIKSLGAEGRMQRGWERFVGAASRTAQRSRFWSALGINLTTTASQLVSVVTVIAGVYLAAEGRLTLGAIIAAVILGGRAVAPLAGLANTLSRFHQAASALATLDRLMRLPVERPQARAFLGRPVTRGEVELRDVAFTYPGARTPALNGLSLRLGAGERVGIIGRVGSGKTTIGRLLIGLYEPAAGAVLLDGVDLRQIDPADIRRGVGLVMQDIVLFHASLRENIAMGQPQAEDAAILAAARLAGVDDFAAAHPEGYAMTIAERGQNLSGGQRQAVALARALLLDPPVLMLDEPTSAMDNASEQQFMQRLAGVLDAGRTLILATHRLSLLKLVDRLVVLDRGRAVADGPREEVLRRLQDRGLARAAGTGEATQRLTARTVVRAAAVRREPPEGAAS